VVAHLPCRLAAEMQMAVSDNRQSLLFPLNPQSLLLKL
jgi:hypothetical protein